MADEVLVPAKVLQGIMECRDAGEHNMFDAGHTILWCYEHQFPEAAEWSTKTVPPTGRESSADSRSGTPTRPSQTGRGLRPRPPGGPVVH
jgi:hypothetical protein